MDLQIFCYNVFLTVPVPLRFNGQKERSIEIPKAICAYEDTLQEQIDVCVFTELIAPEHRKRLLEHLRQRGWFYHTKPLSKNPFFDKIKLVSGGIIIASRYPIIHEDSTVFIDACEGYDCTANKGCAYAKIVKNGNVFNILASHLQAWDSPATQQIRVKQAKDCFTFIQALNIPKEEPVIFAGDLNMDLYTQQEELHEVLDIIHVEMVPREGGAFEFTSDPGTNELMGNDEDSIYATLKYPNGCYDEYVQSGVCVCCPQQYLDYVAFSKDHLRPSWSIMNVHQLKAEKPFHMQFNITTEKVMVDLSDHYPVLAKLKWDKTSPVNESHQNFRTLPKQRSISSLWQTIFLVLSLSVVVIVMIVLAFVFL